MNDALVQIYRAIVSEVIVLYKQQLQNLEQCLKQCLEQSQDAAFFETLEKIVVELEGLVAVGNNSAVPEARALPATRHLASLQTLPIAKNVNPIVSLLIDMQNNLHWRQNPNYNDDLLGKGYMDNYCHAQLVGQKGIYQHPEILLGFYIQGGDLYYPDHNHPAKEVYTILSGRAKWRQSFELDSGEWHEKQSGDFIFHDSLEYHAMHTNIDAQPLIAIYAWYGNIHVDAALS